MQHEDEKLSIVVLSAASSTHVSLFTYNLGCPCLQVGTIRPQQHFLSNRVGPVTCMAWHPYQPLLAAGCGDSTATVYAIENQVRLL